MVQVTIHVRPRDGYTYPGRIKTITLDTSQRLENLVSDLKLDTKKGITLFSHGGKKELALNTSLASNNVQSGEIIETCSSPLLSAALSATLKDFDFLQTTLTDDERTRSRIEPLLDLDGPDRTLDPWPERWNHESVKTRIICLALIKKIIQRQDRFADQVAPPCTNLLELHNFLQETVFSKEQQEGRRTHNSMAHILKPSTSRDGKPSTCWQLLQNKLDLIAKGRRSASVPDGRGSTPSCSIEAFLVAEQERHRNMQGLPSTPGRQQHTPTNRKRPPTDSSSQPTTQRKRRRRLAIESPSVKFKDQNWKCSTCQVEPADSMCLSEGCPFNKRPSCLACFSANHPILQRDHERVPFTDKRAKAVLKAMHKQDKQDLYCPQYGSGPFAILCTLYDQMKRGQHSLDESRLKELAQPICRSNLYDHQAQGRSAFACTEALLAKDLVRMERLPGMAATEGIFSLLPAGEELAKYCCIFEREMSQVLGKLPKSTTFPTKSNNHPLKLLVDSREDPTYAKRLMRRCSVAGVPFQRLELVAGDYLWTLDGKVCPIVVERKSWSDLADSVMGKGRRRLDCVRLFETQQSQCENGRCQLCKMKASGCSQIMFVIEGARCGNRDATPDKCRPDKRCQFCREIQQRHGRAVTHEALENVLFRLQVEHGCFIHYTRSYNETIDALLCIRQILCAGLSSTNNQDDDDMARAIAVSLGGSNPLSGTSKSFIDPLTLTFEQFCKNARRKYESNLVGKSSPAFKDWDEAFFTNQIAKGQIESSLDMLRTNSGGIAGRSSLVANLNESFNATCKSNNGDSSDDSVLLVGNNNQSKVARNKVASHNSADVICLDSDDEDDDNSVVEVLPPSSSKSKTLDEEVEVVLEVKPSPATSNGTVIGPSHSGLKAGSVSQTSLLLLSGMMEYDDEFFKDTSALWKALYQRHVASSTSDNDFRKQCSTEVQKLSSSEAPLISRKSFLFWLLIIQIKYNIPVQVLRQSDHKQRMESLLQGRAQPSPARAAANVVAKPNPAESKQKTPSPSKQHVCAICRNALETEIEVTTCMHCFHSKCLGVWLSREGRRRCPTCNHGLDGAFMDAFQSRKVGGSAKGTSKRPPPRGNTQVETMREARLARLDNTPTRPSRPPLPRPRQRSWSCTTCTLENVADDTSCAVCGSSRSGMAASSSNLPAHDRPQTPRLAPSMASWSCTTCTLRNDADVTSCAVCGGSRSGMTAGGGKLPAHDRSQTPPLARYMASARPQQTEQTGSISKKRTIKCGACGQHGHNRASATEDNCSRYWAVEEIELRAKKREDCERRAQEASEAIDRHQNESNDVKAQLEQTKKALVELEKKAAVDDRLRENEMKRLRQKQAREEKRARKYN